MAGGKLSNDAALGDFLQNGTQPHAATELKLGAHKGSKPGWYSRGYLPHRDESGLSQAITFRLVDALPRETLRRLEEQVALQPEPRRSAARRLQMERWLDAGLGCCALRHPRVAETVEHALLRFDGARYQLLAWCLMPNHVHVLIRPEQPVADIVRSWKSFTGRWALGKNAELELGVPGQGAFWMREYWDRFIRNELHLRRAIEYIHLNPVTAGLCSRPEDWPWSSARRAGLPPGAPGSSPAFRERNSG